LVKSKIEMRQCFLDCCFQPGPDKGIIYKSGVKKQTICIWLIFWERLFHITREEMYEFQHVFLLIPMLWFLKKTSLD
jgi:hypothetical protein